MERNFFTVHGYLQEFSARYLKKGAIPTGHRFDRKSRIEKKLALQVLPCNANV
jgi:hypothetical protein